MAKSEVALAMEDTVEKAESTSLTEENSKEKVKSNPDANSETTVEKSATNDEHGPSSIWTRDETRDPQESFLQNWKKIFVASCLFAVLVDPLFLYVPLINDDMKCLLLDKHLNIAALILRSLTDLFYIVDIIIQIHGSSENYSGLIDDFRRRRQLKLSFLWKSSYNIFIFIDILAILPLPQVAILIFFSKMRDLRSVNTTRMVIMNFFAILQYVPRVLRIYLLCTEIERIPKGKIKKIPIWVKCVLNFSMYIIASHVIGAIWYFFAIQRMTICWHSACRKEYGCDIGAFGCHDHHIFRNITLLNDLCPINPLNPMPFDFGIYTSLVQSSIPGSTKYFQKFSNCFWWGLRNLSSLGSNLEPSTNGWENLFTAFISIIGLLLFLYLIGNVQMYIQSEAKKKQKDRDNMILKQLMEQKGREIELWLFKNGIPTKSNDDMKSQILEIVKPALEEKDANLDDIFSILPSGLQSKIRSCTPLTKINKVPIAQNMDELVLKAICQHLKPKRYFEGKIIFRKNQPLKRLLFIVAGHVIIENKDHSNNLRRGAGEFCGEELLGWSSSSDSDPPLATESVKAARYVEALTLKAGDMKKINMQLATERKEWRTHKMRIDQKMKTKGGEVESWLCKNGIPLRIKSEIMKKVRLELEENRDIDVDQEILSILPLERQSDINSFRPLTRLKQVPLLQNMDEQVLTEISEHLKPMKYTKNDIIIREDEPLQMMLFIVDGLVFIEKRDSSSHLQRGEKELYGEKLLVWPSWTSFPDVLPFAAESVRAIEDVEALVLLASDMVSIGSKFRSHFNELEMSHLSDSQWDLLNSDRVLMLQQVPKLGTMDKQVLKEMAVHLEPGRYQCDINIVQKNEPLSKMFFVTRGEVINNENGRAGKFFGEELLEWVLDKSFPEILPLSTCTAKVVSNDAEILYLNAEVLKNFASNFVTHFSKIASHQLDLFTFGRLTRLKKVKIFQEMDKQVLEAISKLLKPKACTVNTYIIREKEPLEMMFFVVRGVVSIKSDSIIEGSETREMGGFYGEELVHWVTTWASHSSFPAKLPLATGSALCGPRPVKILALTADDLKSVVSSFKSKLFTRETQITLPTYSPPLTGDPLTILKNVERLKSMDEEVLKEISKHLRPKKYENEYIIELDEPKKMMFFIVRGVLAMTNEYWTEYHNEAERSIHHGDDLIDYWVRSKDTAFPKELPISAFSFRAIGEVEVLVLMANDLAKVQPRRSAL